MVLLNELSTMLSWLSWYNLIMKYVELHVFRPLCVFLGRSDMDCESLLGDRGTGKTAIFLFSLIASKLGNLLTSPEGFGSKRVWGIYVGVCIRI